MVEDRLRDRREGQSGFGLGQPDLVLPMRRDHPIRAQGDNTTSADCVAVESAHQGAGKLMQSGAKSIDGNARLLGRFVSQTGCNLDIHPAGKVLAGSGEHDAALRLVGGESVKKLCTVVKDFGAQRIVRWIVQPDDKCLAAYFSIKECHRVSSSQTLRSVADMHPNAVPIQTHMKRRSRLNAIARLFEPDFARIDLAYGR